MRMLDGLIIAAGRKTILPLVRSYVTVSVTVDGAVADGHLATRSPRGAWRSGMLLSVQLAGPGSAPRDYGRMISAKEQASICHRDEVIPAIRRAAEKIIRAHPSWRCLPEPRYRTADAPFAAALLARSSIGR
jgi:hypothetical protein